MGGNVLLIREVQGKIARLDQDAIKNTEAHLMILYCHRGVHKSNSRRSQVRLWYELERCIGYRKSH